jgi:hypothetical protein
MASFPRGRNGEIVFAMAKRLTKGRTEGAAPDPGLNAEARRQTLLRLLAEEETTNDRRPRWRRLKVRLKLILSGARQPGTGLRRPR